MKILFLILLFANFFSIIGAVLIIVGLYAILWGKQNEKEREKEKEKEKIIVDGTRPQQDVD